MSNKELRSAPRLFAKSAFFSVEINKFSQNEERVRVDPSESRCLKGVHSLKCFFFFQVLSNLHPFKLLVGRKGSSRNTFNQVLLQAAKREKEGRSETKKVQISANHTKC